MRLQNKFIGMALLCAAFILMNFAGANAQQSEYSFKVHNRTDSRIKRLLVAEPGQKKWSFFDIGAGIASGKSMTLVWDESTNDENCVQWFKAVYADDSQSEPVKIDFCEDDLELEFTD